MEEADRERIERARRNLELSDLRSVLATIEGKRLINRIFAEGCMFASTFTGNSQGMMLEGKRKLVLWLLDECLCADVERAKETMFIHLEEVEDNERA